MKELVCIQCPRGCHLTIDDSDLNDIKVTGNFCPRGAKFGKEEMIKPMRSICSTVKTIFPEAPVLPVRVTPDIPKDKIFDVMKEINSVVLDRKVDRGDIIIENVLGLNSNVIASSAILKKI